jgi:quercetin dioxygenase-like cupin family protein
MPPHPSKLILHHDEGEVLRLRPPARSGRVTIKVDPRNTHSTRMSMGTQHIEVGSSIPVHLHDAQDEILYVHAGRGTASVGDEQSPVEAGATVFIPRGVWHGVENTGDEALQVVWVVSPPGLEGMFRDISAPPGAAAEPLTPQGFAEVAQRHGMRVRRSRLSTAGS